MNYKSFRGAGLLALLGAHFSKALELGLRVHTCCPGPRSSCLSLQSSGILRSSHQVRHLTGSLSSEEAAQEGWGKEAYPLRKASSAHSLTLFWKELDGAAFCVSLVNIYTDSDRVLRLKCMGVLLDY